VAENYKYSVIVPVYNRPVEVEELLDSLAKQTWNQFDILIVEDGSTEDCRAICDKYSDRLDINYYFKENSGPGSSRNFGMEKATGEYMIFFDSDCLIPTQYFEEVEKFISQNKLDCWGGPDDAHPSFTIIQKAINYSMTSVITTGGVRGKENKLDKFQPRSFNMGISQKVYKAVGGFGDIHPGEDPDLSYRIMDAGFTTGLIPRAHVFHKRRIDFQKFVGDIDEMVPEENEADLFSSHNIYAWIYPSDPLCTFMEWNVHIPSSPLYLYPFLRCTDENEGHWNRSIGYAYKLYAIIRIWMGIFKELRQDQDS
jgi:glycosyltransferase involved in cell wall biosynthesis